MLLTHMFEVNFYIPKVRPRIELRNFQEAAKFFENYLESAHQMNANANTKSTCAYKLNEMEPGQKLTISDKFKVETIKTFHSVPSLGYGFYEIKK